MGTDIHLAAEIYREGQWHYLPVNLPSYRNYKAFSVLADVRNGYSFGGFDTGDPIEPISEPRGLPDDLSDDLKDRMAGRADPHIWLGDHSFSWVTLQELINVNLEAPITMRGMVPKTMAEDYKKSEKPPTTMAAWSANPDWVKFEWQQPLGEQAPLIADLIKALKPHGAPENVRLVFGFDN